MSACPSNAATRSKPAGPQEELDPYTLQCLTCCLLFGLPIGEAIVWSQCSWRSSREPTRLVHQPPSNQHYPTVVAVPINLYKITRSVSRGYRCRADGGDARRERAGVYCTKGAHCYRASTRMPFCTDDNYASDRGRVTALGRQECVR